jgi:hypothetical protein
MLNILLKNVKVNETLSEETICFSADVYEAGKLVAHVSNHGHGGSNYVYPAKGLKYEDVKHLDNLDAECEIFQMVEEINLVKKHQTRHFVLKKDNNIYTVKTPHSFSTLKKYGNYKLWLANELGKFKEYKVLNTNL